MLVTLLAFASIFLNNRYELYKMAHQQTIFIYLIIFLLFMSHPGPLGLYRGGPREIFIYVFYILLIVGGLFIFFRGYVCMYVRTYVRMYVCMYVCNAMLCYVMLCYVMLCYVCMHACTYVYMNLMYVCTYVMSRHVMSCYVMLCMYVRMCVCVYVCMCVCVYVCMQ